ncbi:MAG TPA: chemotaxis protein CheW [Gammaproteobacteria bacterium]
MSEAHKKSAGSLQEQAIHDYLESLLMEVSDELEDAAPLNSQSELPAQSRPIQEFAQPRPSVIGLDKLVEQIPEEWPEESREEPAPATTETVVEPVTEVQAEPVTEVGQAQPVVTEVAVDEPQPQTQQSPVPEWAEQRFQCLLFKVSGLSLAVPLVKLNSVIAWDENITETPNRTDWYLGLIQHLQKQVKVIDTALLVLPENRRDALKQASADRLGHILLVDDYKWGLACESIGDVVWLTKDEVKWRQNKQTRPWLAGTSLQHLCAIMDTDVFADMLNNQR